MRLSHPPLPLDRLRHVRDRFGDPRDGGARVHQAIDLPAPVGTPVYSTVAGRVLDTASLRDPSGRSGWGVSIIDADQNVHHFAHLATRANVNAGEHVEPGALLGAVGSTGSSLRPHLHYQITARDGSRVNPYGPLIALLEEGSSMPEPQLTAAERTWFAMVGRDRYPTDQIVRLGENATPIEIRDAVRLIRGIVARYRVPSRLLSTSDDFRRMSAVSQTYRDAVHQWTQVALSTDRARAAQVVNAVSENLERWLALNHQIVESGPAPGFWSAFEASVRNTGATVARIMQATATGAGVGLGLVAVGVAFYFFSKKGGKS